MLPLAPSPAIAFPGQATGCRSMNAPHGGTTLSSTTIDEPGSQAAKSSWIQWFLVLGLVYLLVVAVDMIGTGFKAAAGDQAKELFAFASNPVTGVIVGTVATALIQS